MIRKVTQVVSFKLCFCFLVALVSVLSSSLNSFCESRGQEVHESWDKVSFYVSAHEDDWQLFMNPPAYDDVANSHTKVVFIHVTAGDAGFGPDNHGRKHPFFLARENGSRSAIRFLADLAQWPSVEKISKATINKHRLHRVEYKNTVAYFLRLPDGSGDGAGYEKTGYQSLERLLLGKSDKIQAVDGSAQYASWKDLADTFGVLMKSESASCGTIQINVPELDEKKNPSDHSDHRHSAKLALEAASQFKTLKVLHFLDYVTAEMPENLNETDKRKESAVFAVTCAGIEALDHESEWSEHYLDFLGKGYYREESIQR